MAEINYNEETLMQKDFPEIKKLGAVSPFGDNMLFAWKERLYRFGFVDPAKSSAVFCFPQAAVRDAATGEFVSFLAQNSFFHSVYVENDTVYVLGVDMKERGRILIYESHDLVTWEERTLFENSGWTYYNTSLTKGPDGYVLALESDHPDFAGVPFTAFFAKSPDLVDWEFVDYDLGYAKDRYIGSPRLIYSDGWYYLTVSEQLPCKRFASYIHRTRDFRDWYVGLYNPIIMPSHEDRQVSPRASDIDRVTLERMKKSFISSNSEIALCEFGGKTYIGYVAGNQLGSYHTAEAEYDGPLDEFLKSFFE
ncbi:MAG: hypothetical protein IKU65_02865 [Oscillospiraceae bacterium]|nr:hypothetical protein [Oscillospiraceae bacterium]